MSDEDFMRLCKPFYEVLLKLDHKDLGVLAQVFETTAYPLERDPYSKQDTASAIWAKISDLRRDTESLRQLRLHAQMLRRHLGLF